MKRIETKEDIEKRKQRNKMIVGAILVFLLFFSSLGYAFYSGGGSSGSSENSNNGEFQQGSFINGRWTYQIGSEVFGFLTFADLAEKVPVDFSLSLDELSGQRVYVDSYDSLFVQEISLNIGRYTSGIQEACNGPCERDLPEFSCDEEYIIVVKESDDSRVYQENKCIFIDGDVVAVDAFL